MVRGKHQPFWQLLLSTRATVSYLWQGKTAPCQAVNELDRGREQHHPYTPEALSWSKLYIKTECLFSEKESVRGL